MARRLLPPAVLQNGAADCGPAVLASALAGFGMPAPFAEMRARLGSDQEGTSIGELERVARELGLDAEEAMLPAEHLLTGTLALPAIAVVLLEDRRTHFVLVWRRWGRFFLVHDPARGRGLESAADLGARLLHHEHGVPAAAWREWAGGAEFRGELERRLRSSGLSRRDTERLLARALASPAAEPLAALDAAARCAAELALAGALPRSGIAARVEKLVETLLEALAEGNPEAVLARRWWSALPRVDGSILLRGALVVRLTARAPGFARDHVETAEGAPPAFRTARGPVLAAAAFSGLVAAAEGLGLAGLARGGGGQVLAMVGVAAAAGLLAAGGAVEMLAQRRAFAAGRREEIAARIDFAERLPELPDAVITSRAVSDLADRVHATVTLRHGPYIVAGALRALAELAAILLGLLWLAPGAAAAACCGSLAAIAGAAASRRGLAELETRWREACARLATLAADVARGGAGVSAWGLAPVLRAEHENALQRWSRIARERARRRGLYGVALGAATAVAGGCALAAADPAALLLVGFWMLRLPALGDELVSRAADSATVGAVRRRLEELRGLPSAEPAAGDRRPTVDEPSCDQRPALGDPAPGGAERRLAPGPAASDRPLAPRLAFETIALRGVGLRLGGIEILRGIDLDLAPGEEVALVGPSGAGKSSLGRLLVGLHPPTGGEIRVGGVAVPDPRALRSEVAFVDAHEALPDEPLAELLVRGDELPRDRALLAALELVGLEAAAAGDGRGLLRRPAELSAEERRRVRLARGAGPAGARILVLDECFRDLPREEARRLKARLRRRSPDAVMLLITHDLEAATEAHRVLVLAGGAIAESGSPVALIAEGGAFAAALELFRHDPLRAWPGAPSCGREPTP